MLDDQTNNKCHISNLAGLMDVQDGIIEQAFLIKLPQKFSFLLLSLEEAFEF